MVLLKKIYVFLAAVFVFACLQCSSDTTTEDAASENKELDTKWTDSVLAKLTPEQNYHQHFIIEVPGVYQNALDSLLSWIVSYQPGGLHFQGWHPDSIQKLKQAIDTHHIVRPFLVADYFEMLEADPYPFWEVNKLNRHENFTRFFGEAGYTLLDFNSSLSSDKIISTWLDSLATNQGIIAIRSCFSDKNAAEEFDRFLKDLATNHQAMRLELTSYDTLNLRSYREANGFDGIFIVHCKEQASNSLLADGADLIYKRLESPDNFSAWKPNEETQKLVDVSTKRIILKKSLHLVNKPLNPTQELDYIKLRMQAGSTALIGNRNKLLPFKGKFTIYTDKPMTVSQKVRTDCGVNVVERSWDTKLIDDAISAKGSKVVMLSDTIGLDILKRIAESVSLETTVIAFENPSHYEILKTCPNLIFYPGFKGFDAGIFVQQLSSRLPMSADFYAGDSLVRGIYLEKKVLARTSPAFCGLDADSLARISGLMSNCMSNRAFPGGQVLVAKDGCIVYDRVFGNHAYNGTTAVTENSMYDIASITKIVATTLVGMKLYEMGLYEMDDSLQQYLPDSLREHLPFPSTIRNITFQELYTHTSGLPSGFPIIKYMRYTSAEVGRYDRFFCDRPDSVYNTEVAEGFYLEREQQDSMWLRMNQIYLNPAKDYNYSDVNMNLLYFMLKSFIQKSPEKFGFTQSKKQLKDKNLFEEYLYNTFYKPLGMNHTRYKPLRFFSRDVIAPTENDTYWRKQLIHGHVHDPNSALHGGIAGNAGIFSTANDLAILCQMWLNKGVYNGQRYLKAETIDKFTSRQENCFRGLGFNKPSMGSTSFGMSENASMLTYGHTGFTGTCLWIDPEYNLIYIYLSNAVHPSVNNKTYEYGIRKKAHQCAYDAMMGQDF